jgi:hypothetical protein
VNLRISRPVRLVLGLACLLGASLPGAASAADAPAPPASAAATVRPDRDAAPDAGALRAELDGLEASAAKVEPTKTDAPKAIPAAAKVDLSEALQLARKALARAESFKQLGDLERMRVALALCRDLLDLEQDARQLKQREEAAYQAEQKAALTKAKILQLKDRIDENLARATKLQAQVDKAEQESVGKPRVKDSDESPSHLKKKKADKDKPKDTSKGKGKSASETRP